MSSYLDNKIIFGKKETLLLSLIKNGDYQCFFDLGQLYIENENLVEGISMLEKGSKYDIQAKYQLAMLYFDGVVGLPDYNKGIKLMKEVALSEHNLKKNFKKINVIRAAQYNIGIAYLYGVGVETDHEQATKFFKLAADDGSPQGFAKAQTALGFIYSDLKNDSMNLKNAFEYHSDACGQGSLESQGILGIMYLFGFGISPNLENALKCLREAAGRGSIFAKGLLITCYYQYGLSRQAYQLATKVCSIEEDKIKQLALETECCASLIRRGISYASFLIARHHHKAGNKSLSHFYYLKAIKMDQDLSSTLYNAGQYGYI